jgi:hypothetical protein
MNHPKPAPRYATDEFEQLASDLSIAVWNCVAQLPQFAKLHPKDFPLVYETLQIELRRLGVRPREKNRNSHA